MATNAINSASLTWSIVTHSNGQDCKHLTLTVTYTLNNKVTTETFVFGDGVALQWRDPNLEARVKQHAYDLAARVGYTQAQVDALLTVILQNGIS